jgi:hypothetical protein
MNSGHLWRDTTANSKDVVVTGVSTGLVGEPQGCLFQRDFGCSGLHATRLTLIVCKESSVTASSSHVSHKELVKRSVKLDVSLGRI